MVPERVRREGPEKVLEYTSTRLKTDLNEDPNNNGTVFVGKVRITPLTSSAALLSLLLPSRRTTVPKQADRPRVLKLLEDYNTKSRHTLRTHESAANRAAYRSRAAGSL